MKQLLKLAGFATLSAAGLTACATPTPYEPARSASDTGYASQQLTQDRHRVSFSGNTVTDRSTVENYLLFRAAELTEQQGYDGFTIVREATERTVDANVTPTFGARTYGGFAPYWRYSRIGPGYSLYDPWFGDPFLGGADINTVDSYEAYATIEMYNGTRQGARNYDASEVIAYLGPTITLPE